MKKDATCTRCIILAILRDLSNINNIIFRRLIYIIESDIRRMIWIRCVIKEAHALVMIILDRCNCAVDFSTAANLHDRIWIYSPSRWILKEKVTTDMLVNMIHIKTENEHKVVVCFSHGKAIQDSTHIETTNIEHLYKLMKWHVCSKHMDYFLCLLYSSATSFIMSRV
ncbi:hypothetical protein ACJX0J_038774, partial [Zea mays]